MTPNTPIVYVLHGLLGTAYGHFGNQIQAWGDRFQVVPLDLPGHGRCPVDATDDYLDTALDYLTAIVERFGPGRLVAASYLGGPLAVRLAEQRPELVNSLVLTGFAPDIARDAFVALLAGFDRLIEENPELAAEYDRLHTTRWRRTMTAFSTHAGARFDELALVRGAQLGALEMEILLLNGTLKSIERHAAEQARTFGPRVHGQLLEGAGHIAGHDAPTEFTRAVEEFWLCGELRDLLQEEDFARSLDSLETVAVLTFLRNRGLQPDESLVDRPTTIEGWGAWAAQRSLVS